MTHSYDKTARLRRAARISFARRVTCEITMEELAKRCGTTRRRISDIENAYVDVNVSQLRRIAKALGTTPEELNRPACSYQRVDQVKEPTA